VVGASLSFPKSQAAFTLDEHTTTTTFLLGFEALHLRHFFEVALITFYVLLMVVFLLQNAACNLHFREE
jgi:hypothetical protein